MWSRDLLKPSFKRAAQPPVFCGVSSSVTVATVSASLVSADAVSSGPTEWSFGSAFSALDSSADAASASATGVLSAGSLVFS